jgi:hypothetical protein
MSYAGTIQNGQVVISSSVSLPEGARVQVILEDVPSEGSTDDWLAEVEKLAKPRNWPQGLARNLDEHLAASHRP